MSCATKSMWKLTQCTSHLFPAGVNEIWNDCSDNYHSGITVYTKGQSFKCGNIIRITAHFPPLLPLSTHKATRMWVNFATMHTLTAGRAGGSKTRQLWLDIIPNISHLHSPVWTANSRLLFLLLSKVFSLYWVWVNVWASVLTWVGGSA